MDEPGQRSGVEHVSLHGKSAEIGQHPGCLSGASQCPYLVAGIDEMANHRPADDTRAARDGDSHVLASVGSDLFTTDQKALM